ncbi:MAG: sulfatase-like hydrolase/transferase [Acidobacteriota bacterium]|nr:sulfatase-like hydrolase/transferase [Acidobacteriota bacterium]
MHTRKLCLFAPILLALGCTSATPSRPNILFLFADDQRADTIGAWGNPHIDTPHLDQLAREGFSFRANYNLGSMHGAVCIPSRAMVNSGKSYFRLEPDLRDTVLLPEVLGAEGYTTFATGKWHNGPASWLRSFQRGTAVFFGGMSDHTLVPLQDLDEDGNLVNDRVDGFSSTVFADAVIDFLQNYKEEAPFYAYVAFTAPHDPRQPPVPYRNQYYEDPPPLPTNFLPQHPFNNSDSDLTGRDERLAAWPRTPEVIQDQLAEYYGLITHLDVEVGRILNVLAQSSHADNTYVIYAADHGLAVGSHGLLGKQSVYEHSQQSPLIIVGPDVPHGETTALTYLFDLVPTISRLTNTPPLDAIDGHDLSSLWQGTQESIRDSLFLAYRDVARAVRDDRYKLIRYPQIDHTQLFDLQADPDELHNLANDEVYSERIDYLTALLRNWQHQLGDTQALTVPSPEPATIDLSDADRFPDQWQPDWIVQKYFE